MFRQSYPQDGDESFLQDEFKGIDYCNHAETQGRPHEDKYNKGYMSIRAESIHNLK